MDTLERWNRISLNKTATVQLTVILETASTWRLTGKSQMGSVTGWFALTSSYVAVSTGFKKTVVGNVVYDSTKSIHWSICFLVVNSYFGEKIRCVYSFLKYFTFDCGCNFWLHNPFDGKTRQIAKMSVIFMASCLFTRLPNFFSPTQLPRGIKASAQSGMQK